MAAKQTTAPPLVARVRDWLFHIRVLMLAARLARAQRKAEAAMLRWGQAISDVDHFIVKHRKANHARMF